VPSTIINGCIENSSEAAQGSLPNSHALKRPKKRGDGRHPPLFPTRMWNQYRRTIAGEDGTSKHAEAAHRKVYAELGRNHPVIWKFNEGIRTVQRGRDVDHEQLIGGKIQTKNSLNTLRLMNAF